MTSPSRSLLAATVGTLLSVAAAAEETGAAPALLERVVVTSTRAAALEATGSVHLLDGQALDRHAYGDVNRVLRQVPGVNLVEEEGFGLRPNIGIRGSGTDRSSKIAVMEDGVPIAPAPYSAPSAYYFPRIHRMSAVELSKGPAAIKYGPQTVAGALGLYSSAIPGAPGEGLGGRFELVGGEHGTLRGHALAGGWARVREGWQLGFSLETLQERSDGFKRLDSGGDTGFDIQDYVAKLALQSTGDLAQSFEFKFQHSEEESDETYLGLSLADFRADPYRRYRGSQLDRMDVEHDTLQLTHRVDFGDRFDLTTIAYRTDTARAWYKLNDVRNAANTAFTSLTDILANPAAFPVEFAALVGAPGDASAPGALRVRNNNREYYAQGLQTVLGTVFETGGIGHELELSARYHRDEEDRFQQDDRYQMVDGVMLLTAAGVAGTQDNRVGEAEAWAFWVRDTIRAGAWTLTPGLRYETIELERRNWGAADPGRRGTPALVRNRVDAFMPGLGVSRELGDAMRFVAGVHRGFVNPSPGSRTDPEQSWNYEAGLRFDRGGTSVDLMGFLNEYENLVGTCTASTGGGCSIGDQFDGGEVRVAGLEFAASHDFGRARGWRLSLPVSAVYTYTQGEFRTSFSSGFGEWGTVRSGDDLPYVPEQQLTLNVGVAGQSWRLSAAVNYVDEARAVAGSGPIPATDRIDGRTLVDLSGEWNLGERLSLFASIENLTDEEYNVAFRPHGARPGAPRTALAGLRMTF